MRGAAERGVQVYPNGKEPIWNWFWRCHGWGLLGRVMAALGAVEMIGLLGFSQLQSEGGLLTFFFILSVMVIVSFLFQAFDVDGEGGGSPG